MSFCSTPQYHDGEGIYEFELNKNVCSDRSNCWVSFQAPEDLFKLEVDGKEVLNLSGSLSYHSNEFFLLPISGHTLGKISILAKDSNQNVSFLNKLCIKIGRYEELKFENGINWFFKTGANLFSAYFLLVMAFFLGVSYWIRQSKLGLALLAYSLVSAVYLISFSEYPRLVFDPIITSGGIHFPLRLLQDLSLIFVFYNIYGKDDSNKLIQKLAWVYGVVIGIYILLLAVGIRDYVFYSRIIIIMAPLVAAPMAIGAWFSFKLEDPTERKVLIPVSCMLFIFQLNDLLVFWKLINSYFTIRIYIPFIVGMVLFLYFKRMHQEATKLSIISEKQKFFKEFLHDVKSPLAVLRIFLASKKENKEHDQLISSALDRIENMVRQADHPEQSDTTKFKLSPFLREVVEQKKIELPEMEIHLDLADKSYLLMDKSKLQRIFSNLINNAYESYPIDGNKILEIKVICGADDVRILFIDKGKGIPKNILDKLFKSEVSNKPDGQGIGLSSAYRYLRAIGGDIKVSSKVGSGTTLELLLPTTSGDVILEEVEEYSSRNMDSPDLILIDDDRYIQLSWKLYAKNLGKSIRTFDSLEAFFREAHNIKRDTPIFLDVNLNGEKSTDHLSQFELLGFKNLTLATGESEESFTNLPFKGLSISGKLPPIH